MTAARTRISSLTSRPPAPPKFWSRVIIRPAFEREHAAVGAPGFSASVASAHRPVRRYLLTTTASKRHSADQRHQGRPRKLFDDANAATNATMRIDLAQAGNSRDGRRHREVRDRPATASYCLMKARRHRTPWRRRASDLNGGKGKRGGGEGVGGGGGTGGGTKWGGGKRGRGDGVKEKGVVLMFFFVFHV